MKPITYALSGALVVVALSLGAPDVWAQARGQQGGGGGGGGARTNSGGGGGGGTAVSRGSGGSSGGSSGGHVSSGSSGSRVSGPSSTAGSGGTAVQRGGARSNPGNPVIGQATGRTSPYYRPGGSSYYRYYPYDPYYLYGYGAFGLGSYYYDPFWWGYPYGYGYYGGYPWGYYGGYAGGGYYDYDRHQDEGVKGGLKLKVKPSNADVFVDGYFVGRVDDYDGAFQRLNLVAGAHHIEIKAQGFETLSLDVKVEPRETVSYHGELRPSAAR